MGQITDGVLGNVPDHIEWSIQLLSVLRLHYTEFRRCQRGATAILFAITSVVVMIAMGGTIDYIRLVSIKTKMQSIIDAAVILSARAITVAQTDEAAIEAIAKNYIDKYADTSLTNPSVIVAVNLQARRVNIDMRVDAQTYFNMPLLDRKMNASATAEVIGQMPICVLGLDNSLMGTVTLRQSARLTANGCAVYSNSAQANSITVDFGGRLIAELVCSAGGGYGDIQPALTKDCPPLEDPLAGRAPPSTDVCDHTDKAIGIEKSIMTSELGQALSTTGEVAPELLTSEFETITTDGATLTESGGQTASEGGIVVLSPGVYCGGILIGGNASVELEPGVYVLRDGPLYVTENARLYGRNVGFYFKGDSATLYFDAQTSISLTAPATGTLAGLLFYEDPLAKNGRLFSILSDDARELTGTIYLSGGTLVVDADQPVADQSAYTAIVARRLALYAGPHLVLNTNYHDTDVPVAIETQYNMGVRLVN